ncbi:hypothetical protein LZ32DRAFT_622780 [Colletotrichum eremochloae]|nr:hypothetical protein LZ32DRAFT_622780 [Colletotrichum eremochloae]
MACQPGREEEKRGREDLILLTGKHLLNAEPPLTKPFDASLVTPNELHYVRNHDPVLRLPREFYDVDEKHGALVLSIDRLKKILRLSISSFHGLQLHAAEKAQPCPPVQGLQLRLEGGFEGTDELNLAYKTLQRKSWNRNYSGGRNTDSHTELLSGIAMDKAKNFVKKNAEK